jgi:hypothetical protein
VSFGCAFEVHKTAEHALDGVWAAVELGREGGFPRAAGIGRNVGPNAEIENLLTNSVRIVAVVGVHDLALRKTFEKPVPAASPLTRPPVGIKALCRPIASVSADYRRPSAA